MVESVLETRFAPRVAVRRPIRKRRAHGDSAHQPPYRIGLSLGRMRARRFPQRSASWLGEDGPTAWHEEELEGSAYVAVGTGTLAFCCYCRPRLSYPGPLMQIWHLIWRLIGPHHYTTERGKALVEEGGDITQVFQVAKWSAIAFALTVGAAPTTCLLLCEYISSDRNASRLRVRRRSHE